MVEIRVNSRDHGYATDTSRQCEGETKKLSYFNIGDYKALAPRRCKNPPLAGEDYCYIHLPAEQRGNYRHTL